MSADSLHGIKNFSKIKRQAINDWLRFEKGKKGKSLFKKREKGVCVCTQCRLLMSKELGDKQILNKRKFAPICIPCCQGRPRSSEKSKRHNDARKNVLKEITFGNRRGQGTKKQNLKELEELFNR